jgi:hypothetical protein
MRTILSTEAEASVRAAQAAYRRVLSSWASDLLTLRSDGLMVTAWVQPHTDLDRDSQRRVA